MSKEAQAELRKINQEMVVAYEALESPISFTNGELVGIKLMLRDWLLVAQEHDPLNSGKKLWDIAETVIKKIDDHFDD